MIFSLELSSKIDLLRSDMNKIENKNETSNYLNVLKCAERAGVYFSNTGRCYVHTRRVRHTWDNARAECKKNGGDLATISNQATQDFVVNSITHLNLKIEDTIQDSNCWIGGERNSGVWSWADGTPWTGIKF